MADSDEGRTTEGETASSEARAESVGRQLSNTKPATPGTATPADEQPVSEDEVTDEVPDSPKGVGKSTTRSGQDMGGHEGKEAGRREAGTRGGSERPVGVSDERDSAGIDPQGSQEDAPNAPSGDQGG